MRDLDVTVEAMGFSQDVARSSCCIRAGGLRHVSLRRGGIAGCSKRPVFSELPISYYLNNLQAENLDVAVL